MIGARRLLLPVKVSGGPVNMAASVSGGSPGECLCEGVLSSVCVFMDACVCVW